MKLLSSTALALLASAALVPAAFAQDTAPATTPDATAPAAADEAPAAADYTAQSVVATVDGEEITLGQINMVWAALPDQYKKLPGDVLFPALIDQVVNQILLAKAGEEEGLDQTDGVKLAVENARRDAIAGALIRKSIDETVTDEAVKAAYDAQVANLPEEQEINASHILVETEDEAKEIKAELDGGADFATLAKDKSTGPSGPQGGELGWFGKGQMVPAFEEVAFGLEKGQVSDPVQTQFGWHVIKLNDTRVKPKPTLDEIHDQLVNQLSENVVRERVDALRAAAKIEKPDTGIPADAIKDPALLGQ
ncbi:peptidylprolyl isomerase [Paroceanicella profunda]|uniref:Parvulin-like PPIase n=1 Tax=Paroceanicella profunda TaxID=2579971 RepID=A0A5B8FZ90_9RHOB|nr:peptidylprolyl isomerase [Paroceanicella profunda]QDL92039.1 peptidylprolyl isomerase [Paroceanicella profunda]